MNELLDWTIPNDRSIAAAVEEMGRRRRIVADAFSEPASRAMRGQVNIEDFPHRTADKIRYADTVRQGHVNNAVFAVLLETGRVEVLCDPAAPLAEAGTSFVIAWLALDFHSEIRWPGTVVIGTRVAAIGHNSMTLEQGLFQLDRCVAAAEAVIVLMDEATRKSRSLPAAVVKRLLSLMKERTSQGVNAG